jgi:curli biogenesis system outer membrane secretion channel CsgG
MYNTFRCFVSLLIAAGVLAAVPAAAQEAPARKRVAILQFDFGTVQSWWDGNWDIGRGISDLVVTELVKDGTYSVVERRRLDDILAEQDLGASGRVDPRTAASIGRLLGVDAVIVGSVTQFGFDDRNVRVGGLGGLIRGPLGGLNVGRRTSKAVVAVDARMVDTATGEILAIAGGKGESRRGSFNGFGGVVGRSIGIGSIDMSASNFQNTILGEATRKAIEELSEELTGSAGRVKAAAPPALSGRVADVDGSTLILNVGSEQGVRVGQTLMIERVVRTVKDPETGEVLREVTEPIGSLRVTEVDNRSAVGTYVGTGAPEVGDRVKSE